MHVFLHTCARAPDLGVACWQAALVKHTAREHSEPQRFTCETCSATFRWARIGRARCSLV
jgi:hypothetical protein